MDRSSIYHLGAPQLVQEITRELVTRRLCLEEMVDLSQRLERYRGTVLEFVRRINSGLFEFVNLLDERLRELELGSARLSIRSDQPQLQPHSMDDWTIKRFPLVRGDLTIDLSYKAGGAEVLAKELSAVISFRPHGGEMEWREGPVDYFRSYRENVTGDETFGDPDLLDLIARINLTRRGQEEIGSGRFRDEPEVIILRRICDDEDWPGWISP